MSRIWIWCGLALFAGAIGGGCCYPGSPCCQQNYRNTAGYTYPNSAPQYLSTPPNGLSNGNFIPQVNGGTQIIDNSGTNAVPSFGAQGNATRTPTELAPAGSNNWTARSAQPSLGSTR